MLNKWFLLLLVIFLAGCNSNSNETLEVVTIGQFEAFVTETNYVTDAEKYGWSIVQDDVYQFRTVNNATWRIPNGKDSIQSKKLPVTQVSYNDAMAYCSWAKKKLPTYNQYWNLAEKDTRRIISDNNFPISNVDQVNTIGNVWEITSSIKNKNVRLAGGSLFCSVTTCDGTSKDRVLYVDKETANINIGFAVIGASKD